MGAGSLEATPAGPGVGFSYSGEILPSPPLPVAWWAGLSSPLPPRSSPLGPCCWLQCSGPSLRCTLSRVPLLGTRSSLLSNLGREFRPRRPCRSCVPEVGREGCLQTKSTKARHPKCCRPCEGLALCRGHGGARCVPRCVVGFGRRRPCESASQPSFTDPAAPVCSSSLPAVESKGWSFFLIAADLT